MFSPKVYSNEKSSPYRFGFFRYDEIKGEIGYNIAPNKGFQFFSVLYMSPFKEAQ